MPQVELTMNQWGEVLRAVRHMKQAHGVSESARKDLDVAEDRIIDTAFQLAKETEGTKASTKDSYPAIDYAR